jgi:hypothetical protein
MVLRLSIPIFAQPATRAVPHVQFHMEMNAGKLFLVGINDGLRHEVIRDILLSASDGRKLKEEVQHIALYSRRRHPALAHSRAGSPAAAKRNPAVDSPLGRRRHQTAGSLCCGAMILEARWPGGLLRGIFFLMMAMMPQLASQPTPASPQARQQRSRPRGSSYRSRSERTPASTARRRCFQPRSARFWRSFQLQAEPVSGFRRSIERRQR